LSKAQIVTGAASSTREIAPRAAVTASPAAPTLVAAAASPLAAVVLSDAASSAGLAVDKRQALAVATKGLPRAAGTPAAGLPRPAALRRGP